MLHNLSTCSTFGASVLSGYISHFPGIYIPLFWKAFHFPSTCSLFRVNTPYLGSRIQDSGFIIQDSDFSLDPDHTWSNSRGGKEEGGRGGVIRRMFDK